MKKKESKDFRRKKSRKGLNLFTIFLSMFILPGLILGLFTTYQTVTLQNWIEVEATVDSTFYKYKSFKKTRRVGKRTRRKSYTKAQARAKYTYQLDGKTYQSDQIALWQGYSKDKERNGGLKKLLGEANTVKAFVNPKDYKEATLVRSIHNGILFGYVSAFACFFVFGAFSGLFINYPSFKFGVICVAGIVILYGWYFGMGGIYLVNCIEVLS